MPKRMPDSWLATDKTFQKIRNLKNVYQKNVPRNQFLAKFEHISSPEAAGAAAYKLLLGSPLIRRKTVRRKTVHRKAIRRKTDSPKDGSPKDDSPNSRLAETIVLQ